MKKWILFALLAIFFIAIGMRTYPLFKYQLWGVDTGEYYYLTKQITASGHFPDKYFGYGITYPYFPGMFVLCSSMALLAKISILSSVLVIVPIIASLSVFLIFLIVKNLYEDDRIGLGAALFISVVMPHVFQTSRPMPSSLADFIFILCLLSLIKSYQDRRFYLVLVLASLGLIITHHLTTYFLVICVVFGLLIREMIRVRTDFNRAQIDSLFIIFILTSAFLYWLFYAVPFRELFIEAMIPIPLWLTVFISYCSLLIIPMLVKVRRLSKKRYTPIYRDFEWVRNLYLPMIGILIFIVVCTLLFGLSAIEIRDKAGSLLFIPLILFLTFIGIGMSYTDFCRDGILIYSWMTALGTSFFVGLVTNSHFIFPHRHIEYMMIPLSVFVGAGFVRFFDLWNSDEKRLKKISTISIATFLIIGSMAVAYPSRTIVNGQQGTDREDIQATLWLKYSVDDSSVVASDNRMSSTIFGFAELNATWYSAYWLFHASNFSDSRVANEIENCSTPSGQKPIDYVLLDRDIKEGPFLYPWETTRPMSPLAIEKFDNYSIKIYDSCKVQIYYLQHN